MMTPAAVSLVCHLGASPYAPTVACVVVFVPALAIEPAHPLERLRWRRGS